MCSTALLGPAPLARLPSLLTLDISLIKQIPKQADLNYFPARMWRPGAKEMSEQLKPTINTFKKYSKIHLRTMDKAQYKPVPVNKWGIKERSANLHVINHGK